jgi:hypothetical protein
MFHVTILILNGRGWTFTFCAEGIDGDVVFDADEPEGQ